MFRDIILALREEIPLLTAIALRRLADKIDRRLPIDLVFEVEDASDAYNLLFVEAEIGGIGARVGEWINPPHCEAGKAILRIPR